MADYSKDNGFTNSSETEKVSKPHNYKSGELSQETQKMTADLQALGDIKKNDPEKGFGKILENSKNESEKEVSNQPPGKSNSESVKVWTDDFEKKLDTASPDELKNIIQESRSFTSSPLPREMLARVHLLTSGAYGRLHELGIDSLENAKSSFGELKTAFKFDPANPDVARYYGRTIRGIANINIVVRQFPEMALNIDTATEAKKVIPYLLAQKNDATAQLIAEDLSRFVDDEKSTAMASSGLKEIERNNKGSIAAAQNILDGDADRAEKMKK